MSIKIALDSAALAALFPEGSEARVELSRAVAMNLVQQLAVKEIKHLDNDFQSQARKYILDQIKSIVGSDPSFGRVELSSRLKAAIEAEVDTTSRLLISMRVKSFWDDEASVLTKSIEKAIEYRVGLGLKSVVKDVVSEVLSKGLK